MADGSNRTPYFGKIIGNCFSCGLPFDAVRVFMSLVVWVKKGIDRSTYTNRKNCP